MAFNNVARKVAAQEKLAAEWNARHPVGTRVYFWPWSRKDVADISRTRSEAYLLGGHTASVQVEGFRGAIALSHVEAVKE